MWNAQYSFKLDQGGQGEDNVPNEGIRHEGTSKQNNLIQSNNKS